MLSGSRMRLIKILLLKGIIAHVIGADAPCSDSADDRRFKRGVVGIRRTADVLDVADQSLVDFSNLSITIFSRIDFDARLVLSRIADDLASKHRQAVDGENGPTLDFAIVAIGRQPLVSSKKLPVFTRSLAPFANS